MRVLVIGGTGLISTSIVRFLAERGDTVTVFNRAQRQPEPLPGVRQVVGDRYNRERFVAQMRELQASVTFDVVIEMIGYKPADAEDLCAAFAGKVAHLIFCSTVDVYSKPPARYPIPDTASRDSPAPWDYAQNKSRCEAILFAAAERGDFALTVLRPAHTYSDSGALLHSLGASTTYIDRLRRGKPIIVHGDGQSLWVSCHAEDVARAFVNACGNSKAFGKGYSLPGAEWMTWNDIHRTVAAAIGAPEPEMVHIPTSLLAQVTDRAFINLVNFQYNNIFDASEAYADLKFQYSIRFKDGARRVYDYLESHGKIASSDEDPLDDRIISAWRRLSAALIEEVKA